MLRTRVIPCLQLIDTALVKTVKFSAPAYIGDPVNTVRIFNELEVDELSFLDIRASVEKRTPNYDLLKEIADECFMPMSYGGGVVDAEMAKKILGIGFEKIVINSASFNNLRVIENIASYSGRQSVVASIDVKKNIWGKYQVYAFDGTQKMDKDPVSWAKQLESAGAGELLLTSIDNEGTWNGYDCTIISKIAAELRIPVIANGGAGQLNHLKEAKNAGASALALGSMVVYQQKGMGVLVNFPDKEVLNEILS